MKKMKVLTIVGTRPEIIRLSRIISKLDQDCDHVLVHTGQNYDYELNQIFFEELGLLQPKYFLSAAGRNAAQTIGQVIISIDDVLEKENPDAVLVLGDTNSCMAAIASKRRKIPIFHMEAGNRCFDMRVPEEINRRIIDHIADINLTYSEIARGYLIREGLSPDCIIKIGSPMYEVLNYFQKSIANSNIISKFGLSTKKYFVVSVHREENVEPEINFNKFINLLNAIGEKYKLPIILSTHPRLQKRLSNSSASLGDYVVALKPIGFFDYIHLQMNAKATLSDSGTITEESSILNFPAVNLRESHERPEGMEEAAVMMVGLGVDRVMQALTILERQSSDQKNLISEVRDYIQPNVSEKVVRIIHSYVDYVNRVVWKKY